MEINAEDATTIIQALRENLQRSGFGILHDEVFQRISEEGNAGLGGEIVMEPATYVQTYINTLTWLLESRNPVLARRGIEQLQGSVEGRVADVVVDIANPFTGELRSESLETLVPNYSSVADGLREVLADLELPYHQLPVAEREHSDLDYERERPR